MKKLTVKNCILTFLQVPVSLVLLAIVYLEFLLTKCLALLDNSLSSPLAGMAARRAISESPETTGRNSNNNTAEFNLLMNWLCSHDNVFIEDFRERLEAKGIGPDTIAVQSDRHLYAVLKPNRTENLRRIKNVLYALDKFTLSKFLNEVMLILK